MIALLKRDRLGHVLMGSDETLLQAAFAGHDIVAYEESSIFTCHIAFANYVVTGDRLSGLSLPHLAFGDLRDEARVRSQPAEIVYYIYDSMGNDVLCKDIPDQQRTITEIWANNPHYAALTWYSTRPFAPAGPLDGKRIRELGDQFKLRLTFGDDLHIILRPDIIYFPDDERDFLVKSSAMVLPTALARDPWRYAATGRPLVANTSFGVSYLNLDSTGLLTIIHTPRFAVQESTEDALERVAAVAEPAAPFVGRRCDTADGHSQVTRVTCQYELLLPTGEATR
jgi:hypothetical protein